MGCGITGVTPSGCEFTPLEPLNVILHLHVDNDPLNQWLLPEAAVTMMACVGKELEGRGRCPFMV